MNGAHDDARMHTAAVAVCDIAVPLVPLHARALYTCMPVPLAVQQRSNCGYCVMATHHRSCGPEARPEPPNPRIRLATPPSAPPRVHPAAVAENMVLRYGLNQGGGLRDRRRLLVDEAGRDGRAHVHIEDNPK